MKFEWQRLVGWNSHGEGDNTDRAKVHGGWIVRNTTWADTEQLSESMVFVPDINHEWTIDND